MQFTKPFKEQIRRGAVTLTFRTWSSPRVKIGGLYRLHPSGAVRVTSVDRVTIKDVSDQDARRAGMDSVIDLRKLLVVTPTAKVYRVGFEFVAEEEIPTSEPLTLDEALAKLDKIEKRSRSPWAFKALRTIGASPGLRAADLASEFGWGTSRFKTNIRKLKKLGLTESLEVGYRLTPLGQAAMASCPTSSAPSTSSAK